MSDIRTLKTLAEEPLDGNAMTGYFSVTAGMPVLEALEASSCHLSVVLDVLRDAASNSTECSSQMYAAIAVAGMSKGLLDAAVSAIAVDSKEMDHG
ncbi:DUF3077 domain-containing protein [Burkholderia anthina]|uniref:DUF3077 domain-containing protein n=1 Tax=Burkholderia anthina TaxID=179879 RepID=A0ABS2B2D6_9BURK|nr:DUF3077 domain-containing protein [Burkholderia anthina]MBM2767078.1 DUF3077 domain-containing protein [Burkholderia anthina]